MRGQADLVITRVECVIPGPPLRGILSPVATSLCPLCKLQEYFTC
jgi:hypothetical protein